MVFDVFEVLGVDGVLSEASDGFYPLYLPSIMEDQDSRFPNSRSSVGQ